MYYWSMKAERQMEGYIRENTKPLPKLIMRNLPYYKWLASGLWSIARWKYQSDLPVKNVDEWLLTPSFLSRNMSVSSFCPSHHAVYYWFSSSLHGWPLLRLTVGGPGNTLIYSCDICGVAPVTWRTLIMPLKLSEHQQRWKDLCPFLSIKEQARSSILTE